MSRTRKLATAVLATALLGTATWSQDVRDNVVDKAFSARVKLSYVQPDMQGLDYAMDVSNPDHEELLTLTPDSDPAYELNVGLGLGNASALVLTLADFDANTSETTNGVLERGFATYSATADFSVARRLVMLDLVQGIGALRVATGVCYAEVREKFAVSCYGGDIDDGRPWTAAEESSFRGGGVHLGLAWSKTFGGTGLSVNGGLDTALVAGRLDHTWESFDPRPFGGYETVRDNDKSEAVPITKANVGLGLNVGPAAIEAGYEFERWFGVVAQQWAERRDLTLHGPCASVTVAF